MPEEALIAAVEKASFDLRPAGIIEMLDLRRPIYKQTAAYGHFDVQMLTCHGKKQIK